MTKILFRPMKFLMVQKLKSTLSVNMGMSSSKLQILDPNLTVRIVIIEVLRKLRLEYLLS